MLNRRQLLVLMGFTAGGAWRPMAAAAQQARKAPKLKTVTLAISGMT